LEPYNQMGIILIEYYVQEIYAVQYKYR